MGLDNPTTPMGLRALEEPGISLDALTPAQASLLLGEQEAPPEEADAEQEATEAETAEDESIQAEAQAAQDDSTEPTETDDASADESGSEWELPESLSGLAESLNVDPEALGKLRVSLRADGHTDEVTLEQLQRSYQLQSHVARQRTELMEERESAKAELSQSRQQLAEEYQRAQQVAQMLAEQMVPPEPDADLRQNDPAEYAAQVAERGAARDRIAKLQNELAARQQRAVQEQQQQVQEQIQKMVTEGRQKLSELYPNWGDESQQRLTKYLTNEGFSSDEIGQTYDWRMVNLAEKARLYDESQVPKEEIARKKVAKAPPKVMRPGPAQRPDDLGVAAVMKTRQRATKSGSLEDVYDYLMGAQDFTRDR